MSCMEHRCVHCGYLEMDNEPLPPHFCPKCGSADFTSTSDEVPDRDDQGDDDDDA